MAQICRQITVVVDDKVGRLAELTDAIKDAGVNILALCAWVEDGTGRLMAVTDDPDKACAAVTPLVTKCGFNEVVCTTIANEIGTLNAVARKLADAGISIRVIYLTAGDLAQGTVVMITSDNAKAAEIL